MENKKEDCVFCKIVSGKIPCYKIWEDKDTLVFLDNFPSMLGQTLVIPKQHIAPYLFEAEDKIYSKLMLNAKKIARALDKTFKTIKTGMMVEGLQLDHVHIKLYPFITGGFDLKPLSPKPSEKEMKEITAKIKREF